MRTLACVLLAMLVGCGGGNGGGGDDDAPAPDAALREEVTFHLIHLTSTEDAIYVQTGTAFGGQGWLSVLSGEEPLQILDDCGQCNCDSCDPCPVCGAGLPEVTEIPRGGQVEWTWDFRAFGNGTCVATGAACEQRYQVNQTRYTARFCWSLSATGVGDGHHVGPLVCADQAFDFGPLPATSGDVAHEI